MQTEHTVTAYGCRASTMELHQNVIERAIRATGSLVNRPPAAQSRRAIRKKT